MALGCSLVVIAAGSILRYAYTPTTTHGFNYPTMGLILMIFGIIGAVASVIDWAVKRYQQQQATAATASMASTQAHATAARRDDVSSTTAST